MGSSSPQRYSWGTPTRCHRLSDGLHTLPSSITIRQSEMTEQIQVSNLQNTTSFIDNNNVSETEYNNFIGTGGIKRKHRDSYGSLE